MDTEAKPQQAPPQWMADFDERANKQIVFARLYAKVYHHGADGHNNMMIIAQMAEKLDKAEGYIYEWEPYARLLSEAIARRDRGVKSP